MHKQQRIAPMLRSATDSSGGRPQHACLAAAVPLTVDLDIWLAQHESGRSQQDAVHASDHEISFAPTGYLQQFLHGKRNEPLAERPAGGHNAQSKAAALLEP